MRRRQGPLTRPMALVALVAALALSPASARAEPKPSATLPAERLVQLARPATVLVRSKVKAKVTLPFLSSKQAVYEQFVINDPDARAAARRNDLKGVFDAFLTALAARPERFVTENDSDDVDIDATGSGFVIAERTVMTNSHVVFGDDAGTAKALLQEVVSEEDARQGLERELGPRAPYTQAVFDKAADAMYAYMIDHGKAEDLTKTLTVERAVRTGAASLAATTRKAGSRYPGDDLALLDVKDLSHVPTLRFAAVQPLTGEDVFVLGFPGAATFQAGTDEASKAVPTLTKGIVSATKMSEAGIPIVQFDASLAPGNSGGPVFSKTGEVVGVSVAGISSTDNNFAIAATKAATFAAVPPPSAKDREEALLFEHSLRALESRWLRIAEDDIEDLEKAYPNETVVLDLRAELERRRAAKEADLSPDPPRSALLIGLAAAAALLLVANVPATALSWRRRRRTSRPAPPAPPLYPPPG